jgi:hypothetical protein
LGVFLLTLAYSFFAVMLGGLFSSVLSLAAEDPRSAPSAAIPIGACVLVAVALAMAQVRFRPGRPLTPRHVLGGKDAVEIARFSSDSIVLRCHNNNFAAELIAANPGSAYAGAA